MNKFAFLILVALTFDCYSQVNSHMKKFMDVTPFGYSQYVQVDLGSAKMLVISGQVGIDKDGRTVGVGNLSKQLEQAFTNIKGIVEKAGGTMSDIVKLNYYLIDISQIQLFRQIRDKFIDIKNPPASTAVQVSKLFRDDILVEIEATIIVAKNK